MAGAYGRIRADRDIYRFFGPNAGTNVRRDQECEDAMGNYCRVGRGSYRVGVARFGFFDFAVGLAMREDNKIQCVGL